jgi:hypothetical protein
VITAVRSAVLQPAKEPTQLGAEHGVVRQAGEQRLEGVERDALRADRIDRVRKPDEEPFEVVLPGLLDLAALDADVVDCDLAVVHEPVEVEAERADVGGELVGGLLEHHEDAGLAVAHRALDDELGGEHRLAAAGAADHERRPAARQAAGGDLVEAVDPARRLRHRRAQQRLGPRLRRPCARARALLLALRHGCCRRRRTAARRGGRDAGSIMSACAGARVVRSRGAPRCFDRARAVPTT